MPPTFVFWMHNVVRHGSRVCFLHTLKQIPSKSRGQSTENGTQTPNVKLWGSIFEYHFPVRAKGGERHRISQGIVKSVVWTRSCFTAHGNQTVAGGGQQSPHREDRNLREVLQETVRAVEHLSTIDNGDVDQ